MNGSSQKDRYLHVSGGSHPTSPVQGQTPSVISVQDTVETLSFLPFPRSLLFSAHMIHPLNVEMLIFNNEYFSY